MSASETWPELVPFDTEKLPAFPVDALPAVVRRHVIAVANNLQVAADMPAVIGLSVATSAVAAKFLISPKDGWEEVGTLFVVGIAGSGSRKTAVVQVFRRVVHNFEDWLRKECAGKLARSRATDELIQEQLRSVRERVKGGQSDASALEEVLLEEANHERVYAPRLLIDDSTPETLSQHLAQQPNMFALSAEGTFFESVCLGRYSNAQPRVEGVLQSYNAEPFVVDRKSGSLRAARPILTCGLLVQPDVWEACTAKKSLEGRGLLPRFLVAQIPRPANVPGFHHEADRREVDEASADFESLMLKLYQYRDARVDEPSPPEVIHFGSDARRVFGEFADEVELAQANDGPLSLMPSWASKYAGAVARIAGILHIVEAASSSLGVEAAAATKITADKVRAAIAIGKYFEEHKLALSNASYRCDKQSDASAIARWLQRRAKKTPTVTTREVQQAVRRVNGQARVIAALGELQERGYLRVVGGVIKVRPELLFNTPTEDAVSQERRKAS